MNTIAIRYNYDASKLDILAAERPAHCNYFRQLFEDGIILASGPLASNSALIIMNMESPQAALELLENDPLYKAGVIEERNALVWNAIYSPWGEQ
ncbi:MAG: hypothetical protein IKZ87_03525 [Actinomycetaceae bacterium]|nr:hypothetical protein [Actinomycetaceae bacterium]